MDCAIGLSPALSLDARDVDRHFGAIECGGDRARVTQVRLDGLDLPDAADRLQKKGEVWAAYGDTYAPASAYDGADDMTS